MKQQEPLTDEEIIAAALRVRPSAGGVRAGGGGATGAGEVSGEGEDGVASGAVGAAADASVALPDTPFLRRLFGHFATITKHKLLVGRLCFKAGLYRQGLTHDLSKYAPSEFWCGVRYYQGWRSPNALQREVLGYSPAWLHHKGRNKHHFEYWTDLIAQPPAAGQSGEGGEGGELHGAPDGATGAPDGATGTPILAWTPIPMPMRYVAEMFCDRIAASKVYLQGAYTQSSALTYFRRELARAPKMMHPQTRETLEHLLTVLAQEGEDAAFAEVRRLLAKDGKRE